MPKRCSTSSAARNVPKLKVKKNILPVPNQPSTITGSGNANIELALLADFQKLRGGIPDLLNLVLVEKDFWFPNLEKKDYPFTLLRIFKSFKNLFESSPLLEDSIRFQFSKIFPFSGEVQIRNIVGFGCFTNQRMHHCIHQVKKWRENQMLKNQLRVILERNEAGGRQFDENRVMADLNESLDKKTRRILEYAFGRRKSPIDMERKEDEENKKSKFGYGEKMKMVEAVRQRNTNLQTKISEMEDKLRRLRNPPVNHQNIDLTELAATIDGMEQDLRKGTFSWIQKHHEEPLGDLETKKYVDVETALLRSIKQREQEKYNNIHGRINKVAWGSRRLDIIHDQIQSRIKTLEGEKETSDQCLEKSSETLRDNQMLHYETVAEAEEKNEDVEKLLEKELSKQRKKIAKLSIH